MTWAVSMYFTANLRKYQLTRLLFTPNSVTSNDLFSYLSLDKSILKRL